MVKSRIWSTILSLGALCLGAAGCGGGGGGGGGEAAPSGGLRFSIAWPTERDSATLKRLIPFNTTTIQVSVINPTTNQNLVNPVTVTRGTSAVEQVMITDLPPGAVRVAAEARDSGNTVLANGTVDATVTSGETTNVNLSLFPTAPNLPGL